MDGETEVSRILLRMCIGRIVRNDALDWANQPTIRRLHGHLEGSRVLALLGMLFWTTDSDIPRMHAREQSLLFRNPLQKHRKRGLFLIRKRR